jgi:hypothetical protein
MSSTLPTPSNPQVQSPNPKGNNCASWRSHVFRQAQNAYPSPLASHHEPSSQELLSVRAITRYYTSVTNGNQLDGYLVSSSILGDTS